MPRHDRAVVRRRRCEFGRENVCFDQRYADRSLQRLFAAVKEKTGKDKAEMSKRSQELAEHGGAAEQSRRSVYVNGLTATTFSPTLPEIRVNGVSGSGPPLR